MRIWEMPRLDQTIIINLGAHRIERIDALDGMRSGTYFTSTANNESNIYDPPYLWVSRCLPAIAFLVTIAG
jgi:hypothetical protein